LSGLGHRLRGAIAEHPIPTGTVLRSALYGAIGCAVGALLAQFFYVLAPTAAQRPERAIVQVIDVSGSMSDKIETVKKAARQFSRDAIDAGRKDGVADRVALVAFSDTARIVGALTNNFESMDQAIGGLSIEGGTMIGRGLEEAESVLRDAADRSRAVLLFSDGKTANQQSAAVVARRLRDSGVRIVAIGTDDASVADLAELTGDSALVLPTTVDRIPQAFENATKTLAASQFASSSSYAWFVALILSAALGGLMGAGLGLALALFQVRSMRGDLVANRQRLRDGALGGGLAGIVAAAAGQVIYLVARQIPLLGVLSPWIGWTLMGLLLGAGMARVIPNLTRARGALGGALGGAIGGLGFLLMALFLADAAGRVLGAACMGFAVGMMIVLIQTLSREAWLILRWGPKESSSLGLGATPITLGSSPVAHVRLDPALGYPPEYGSIRFQNGRVELVEKATGKAHPLANGNKIPLGKVEIEVRTV
jgi:Ca-activated chloride channel family protein